MGFHAQRSANIRGHFPVGTCFCAFAFFALRCRKRCQFIHSKFSMCVTFDHGHSATLRFGIFPVRFSVEPASLRISYANANALEFYRFPSGADYNAVCVTQMRPLSRNSDFALLGHGAFDGFPVRGNHSLLSVRLDVFAIEKAGFCIGKGGIIRSVVKWRKARVRFNKSALVTKLSENRCIPYFRRVFGACFAVRCSKRAANKIPLYIEFHESNTVHKRNKLS